MRVCLSIYLYIRAAVSVRTTTEVRCGKGIICVAACTYDKRVNTFLIYVYIYICI